jgi:transcriptional regulator GlxA family with amidase domain
MLSYLKNSINWTDKAQRAHWSAGSLAMLCNVSLRTLERYFLKEMGDSPKNWLKHHRQKMAAKLIKEGFSVKEVASALEYKYASQFSRDFKRCWGHSPNCHRAIRQRDEETFSI